MLKKWDVSSHFLRRNGPEDTYLCHIPMSEDSPGGSSGNPGWALFLPVTPSPRHLHVVPPALPQAYSDAGIGVRAGSLKRTARPTDPSTHGTRDQSMHAEEPHLDGGGDELQPYIRAQWHCLPQFDSLRHLILNAVRRKIQKCFLTED